MFRSARLATLYGIAASFFALALTLLLTASIAQAGPFDKLKKKVEKTTGTGSTTEDVTKATEAAERALSADSAAASEPAPSGGGSTEAAGAAGATGAAAAPTKVSTVSTKFDFVSGDSVMFFDNFTGDELGEFPARWKLVQGTFEVADMEGERWLRCVSPDARIRMKVPGLASLPEYWTLEFDFFGQVLLESALTVSGMTADGYTVWAAVFPMANQMTFRTGEIYSATPFEGPSVLGRHHVMVMARGMGVKVYIDTQRMVNVPEIEIPHGMPTDIEYRLWANTKPMITNVRFAEGCRPRPDLMADGKFVTYGIHFKSGSDVVLPESAPILRQVSTYMQSHAAVNLQITGFTDNVGTAAANLDLSKRRAASVAAVLTSQFNVAAERFKTDGKGDGDPIASNKDEQGRAMNRRVMFSKL